MRNFEAASVVAAALSISPIPVKEALALLERDGLDALRGTDLARMESSLLPHLNAARDEISGRTPALAEAAD